MAQWVKVLTTETGDGLQPEVMVEERTKAWKLLSHPRKHTYHGGT